ncbi:MAG: hypothetical protein NC124_17745 [Clostridium sp.]|nr:hypothetical protein [Clostridium sp.]
MNEFLKIISSIIRESKLQYDIFLLADLITGFCMNSKYKFPIYSFSEKLCAEYSAKYHMGYFRILSYYEREKAIKKFFEYAQTEQIIIEENVRDMSVHMQLISMIHEIERRPGQYISRDDVKHVRAFLEGYFTGEDLNIGVEIGTSIEKFDYEFGEYVSQKYELYEDIEWYYKLEFITAGLRQCLQEFVKCLNDFYGHLSNLK